MTFFKNVLANAAGGILVIFFMWLFELWVIFWNGFKFLWHLISRIIFYEISMPVWQLSLLLLVIKFLQILMSKYKNKKTNTNKIQAEDKKFELTRNEELVVKLLVEVDGRWLTVVDMAELLSISRLLVEQALDTLLKKQFIDDRYNIYQGASYRLSSLGRDYVIDKGYVQQSN